MWLTDVVVKGSDVENGLQQISAKLGSGRAVIGGRSCLAIT